MFFGMIFVRIPGKVRTFAVSKEKERPSVAALINNLIKDNTILKERKITMTTVTSTIAFAIVAIAAIVSNASVFSSRLN